jgi:Flp pilus assembly protein TadD
LVRSRIALSLFLAGVLVLLAFALVLRRGFRATNDQRPTTNVQRLTSNVSARSQEPGARSQEPDRPADPQAHHDLAAALEASGRLAEAAWEYQEAATLRPGGGDGVFLAVALARMRLTGTAITLLEEMLKRPPVRLDARRALAEFYLVTGRPEEAVSVLAAGGAETQSSLPATLALGRARLALDHLPQAEQAFASCRARAPKNAEVYLWLGEVAARAGRRADARALWEKGARLAPTEAEFLYRIGKSLMAERAGGRAVGRPTPAAAPWRERQRATAVGGPIDPGSAERAERALAEARRLAPKNARVLAQIGLMRQRAGRHREAAALLLRAIQADPSAAEPHLPLAASLEALGETAEAWRHRGLYYALAERPSRALAPFTKFGALRADSADGAIFVSQSLIQMQQNERATAVVAAALQKHPQETALRESLATLYLMTLSRREAADTCAEWLRHEPNAARPHWILGRAAQSNQRLDEAVSHFETAVEREPANPEYLAALAGALLRRGASEDLPRARDLLQRSLALAPNVADTHIQLGAIHRQDGDDAAALSQYLTALNLDPTALGAYTGLVQVAQRLRRPRQVALWARAMREVQDRKREETRLRREAGAHPQDATRFFALGNALIRSGNLARAEAQLEEAVALRPDWLEARRLLGRVNSIRAVL